MKSQLFVLAALPLLAAASASGQQSAGLLCVTSATPPMVHSEGVAERLGDIVLTCTGGQPGNTLQGNLNVTLSVPITNKLTTGNRVDVLLSAQTGDEEAESLATSALLQTGNRVAFNGFRVTVPPAGTPLKLRISNLRGNVTLIAPSPFLQVPVTAQVSTDTSNIITVTESNVTIGIASPSLLATVLNGTLKCSQRGAGLPATATITQFVSSGAVSSTTRVTEAFATALHRREPLADNGVRILVRYGGFPTGATVYVPDVIAGSTATAATSAGAFGVPASGGIFTPTEQGSLVLARVAGHDANGAGGEPVFAPGSETVAFNSLSPITLSGGTGIVVYEVVADNPGVLESFQIPSFLGLAPNAVGATTETAQEIVLAPVSTTPVASATAPVPRFTGGISGSDCGVAPCTGSWVPQIRLDRTSLSFTATAGAGHQIAVVNVLNGNPSAFMPWHSSVRYENGSNWIRMPLTAGFAGADLRVDVLPQNLTPGTYKAVIVFDAGLGGTAELPVTLQVNAPQQSATNPEVKSTLNAASFEAVPLVRGSFATLMGQFAGTERTVTFDGVPAQVVYADARQINLLVPASLGSRAASQLIVTVDGVPSAPVSVRMADSAPGIFSNGVLNQDYSYNAATNPARAGSVLQIFATGLLTPDGGTVQATLGGRVINVLDYAGPAPGIPGLQQVNLPLPENQPAGTTELSLCSAGACSASVRIHVR